MLYRFLKLYCLLIPVMVFPAKHLISINKNNVVYRFVQVDEPTDYFATHVFQNWENETFEVFDQVKDPETIAIDIGAWIGTTAIWLCKNFHHVIAIEPDVKSLKCLRSNLAASGCFNVSICAQPISDVSQRVIFGPRGSDLNESISYIKNQPDHPKDYNLKSLTFKQLVYDYILDNELLENRRISFIKCDIEGGEEDILEDLLHFAYYNQCKVYLSFHLNWWKSKKITDFESLFRYFKTNSPEDNLCEYLALHPFESILFEPLEAGVLVKKQIPALIIGYNQPTYIKNMVQQLEKYTSDIIIVDNASTFQPLLDYYDTAFKYTLLKQKSNQGAHVYWTDRIQKIVGDLFLVTDPDLQFNPRLPEGFMGQFIDIMNYFQARRVGFALLIDADDIRNDITFKGQTIQMWESQFWQDRLIYPPNPSLEMYKADIDSTFCLINRRFHNPSIRVAGDYGCLHIPWHKNFHHQLQEGEYQHYLINNISTNWYPIDAKN